MNGSIRANLLEKVKALAAAKYAQPSHIATADQNCLVMNGNFHCALLPAIITLFHFVQYRPKDDESRVQHENFRE